ncbi:MAG: hypothetical protein ACRETB_02065 [Steroidobacteraceae bacterium]
MVDSVVIFAAKRTPIGAFQGALAQRGMSRRIASLCIGGGEAVAVAVETP